MSTSKRKKEEESKYSQKKGIENISKPAIQRILRKGGVIRIQSLVFETIRGIILEFLENLCRRIVLFVEYNNRVTVQRSDLDGALETMKRTLAAGLNPNTKTTFYSSFGHGEKKKSKDPNVQKHRFKPGTVAAREVRKQQRSTFFAIPKLNFARLVRYVCYDFKTDLKFENGILDLIHIVTEELLVRICSDANSLALYSKRLSVRTGDFDLVLAKFKYF